MAKKKKKKKSLLTRHHTLPSSRSLTSSDWSVVLLPAKFHQAFHYLFGNLTIEETHKFLDIVLVPGKAWTHKKLMCLIESIKENTDEIHINSE